MILNEIPAHNSYSEPFAGGASVFFAKTKAEHNQLNDLDNDVINTLLHIRDRVEELIGLLDGIPVNKETHSYYKNKYQPQDDLTKSFRWYYLNRTSYSGIMRPENCYWGYGSKYSMKPDNWPPHLRTVSDKLQGVELTSLDYEPVIDNLPANSFVFVDPPYYAANPKIYNCVFTVEDHIRLSECLKRNTDRLLFLLTYDDHPEVRSLYDWVETINRRQWNYTINRTDDQRNKAKLEDGFQGVRAKGRQLFIRNYLI